MPREGGITWLHTRLVPLKNESGQVYAVLGVSRDITELRDRTLRLEEANIALKVLLRHRDEDKTEQEEKLLAKFNKLILNMSRNCLNRMEFQDGLYNI